MCVAWSGVKYAPLVGSALPPGRDRGPSLRRLVVSATVCHCVYFYVNEKVKMEFSDSVYCVHCVVPFKMK